MRTYRKFNSKSCTVAKFLEFHCTLFKIIYRELESFKKSKRESTNSFHPKLKIGPLNPIIIAHSAIQLGLIYSFLRQPARSSTDGKKKQKKKERKGEKLYVHGTTSVSISVIWFCKITWSRVLYNWRRKRTRQLFPFHMVRVTRASKKFFHRRRENCCSMTRMLSRHVYTHTDTRMQPFRNSTDT